MRSWTLLLVVLLAGCFGGSSHDHHDEPCGTLTAPGAGGPDAPVADAGFDYMAAAGEQLFLDGSASSDPHGRALTYHWVQVAGPCVALDLTDPARPTLMVPDPHGSDELVFRLVVEAENVLSPADEVSVRIQE